MRAGARVRPTSQEQAINAYDSRPTSSRLCNTTIEKLASLAILNWTLGTASSRQYSLQPNHDLHLDGDDTHHPRSEVHQARSPSVLLPLSHYFFLTRFYGFRWTACVITGLFGYYDPLTRHMKGFISTNRCADDLRAWITALSF